ncbi:MAG: hypothetical protein ACYSQY_11400, partial [Planctomycetota bacterium]
LCRHIYFCVGQVEKTIVSLMDLLPRRSYTLTVDNGKELRHNLEITRDCVVEIIMKDNHTIANCPENVVKWCRIVKEEIGLLM